MPRLLGVRRYQSRGALDPAAAAASYVGPGDTKSGAYLWYGLRAYDAAYATGSNPAIDVTKASDGSVDTTINILSSGYLDVASVAALGYAVKVKKLYDQSGNGRHATQSTLASMPALTLNAFGSLPAIQFAGAGNFTTTSTTIAPTQPFTVSMVVENTGGGAYWACPNGGNLLCDRTAADTIRLFCGGSGATATMTDNALHAVQTVVDGASSDMCIDGSSNSVTVGALGATSNKWYVGDNSFGAFLTGYLLEQGFWNSAFSSGEKTAVTSGQRSSTTGWNF